ncbi:MAG: InlB B-repeat-containing protein [Clostridiales bacterium]|nr:InlB B-repeat-containing protein [Clostridiales bacterium]
MSIIDSLRSWPRAKKITVAVIAGVAVAAIGVTAFLIHRNNILATTMRLLKVEGTVNIEDASGNVKPVIDNIRFQSGDTLSTGADGLASIGLDDTKIVTLQNDSSAQFMKNGKQIELKLKQGGVFFEVTEKLTDDETYEIETSNMTVGIRGTSGYVWYDESGLQSLIITDGKVVVSGYNPQTGETKTVEVCGGQRVSCYLYSDITEDRTSIEFELTDVSEEELPEFALQMLAENDALLDKVCEETGWDKDELLALVDALLDPDTPTPTPDEIIEITDTPTATPKATNTPIPTISPTTSPSPATTSSPGATVTPTPGATTTPGETNIPTATPATTEAPVPTVTDAPTATPTTAVVTYKVSFDVNGHGDSIEAQTVDSGDKAELPATPSEYGYIFTGWYTNNDLTEPYDFDLPITSDITLYAGWDINYYTVTFDANGHGSAPAAQIVEDGDTVSKPTNPSDNSFVFYGWYLDEDCTDEYDFSTPVTSDLILYANWIQMSYSVIFDTNGHGTAPATQNIVPGQKITEPEDPSDDDYAFLGWYTDAACNTPYDFDKLITGKTVLYAKWTPSPALPDGYSKYTQGWGKEYYDTLVFIGVSGNSYIGYENDGWVNLELKTIIVNDGGSTYYDFKYTANGVTTTYYSWGIKRSLNDLDWAIIELPDGYTAFDKAWYERYDGHNVCVCYNPDSSDDYMAYDNNTKTWFKVTRGMALNPETGVITYYFYYITDDGQTKYYYFWSEG